MKKSFLLLIVVVSLQFACSTEQQKPAKTADMTWWRDARFGLFIHWGLSSLSTKRALTPST